MSLDRQRILGELGSVMNQLKSVDCGCMGKLFANQNQGQTAPMVHGPQGSSLPACGGCSRGCCNGHGHSHGFPCAGEPHSIDSMNLSMNRPCMGNCNPHKLYADTYNYLNKNLMQPVVKEVYDDLKSINPANTIMNNPLASQMGFTENSGGMPRERGNADAENKCSPLQNMPGMKTDNTNSSIRQQQPNNMDGLRGMGPQIVNMIMGDTSKKPSNVQQIQGQDTQHNKTMGNHLSTSQCEAMIPAQYNIDIRNESHTMGNINQNNAPTGKKAIDYLTNSAVQQLTTTNQNAQNPVSMMQNVNPGAGQLSVTKQTHCGQHSQGMSKFNEMFPGVMQGGDLGYDPMAIAIQMNPANQQKAATNTMQRIMVGGPSGRLNVSKTPTESTAGQDQYNDGYSNQGLTGQISMQQTIPPAHALNQLNLGETVKSRLNTVPQQQVYNAATVQPTFIKEQIKLCQQPPDPTNQHQQQYNQSYIERNSRDIINVGELPTSQQSIVEPNGQSYPTVTQEAYQIDTTFAQPMIKEPIYPTDTLKNQPMNFTTLQQYSQYNTLGQPVQMLPAKMFHQEEPSLPQTLSPQPSTKLRNDYMKYSNVKSTVSKTSLTGIKPVGQTPSRSQLQHIYNRYKGSQSFTQQDMNLPVQGGTISDGSLDKPSTVNPPQRVSVERVGGDTIANNEIQTKVGQIMGEVGDVIVANKPREMPPIKNPSTSVPARQAKLRNGLQDVLYTSYPSSAAWSFHGTPTNRPDPMRFQV